MDDPGLLPPLALTFTELAVASSLLDLPVPVHLGPADADDQQVREAERSLVARRLVRVDGDDLQPPEGDPSAFVAVDEWLAALLPTLCSPEVEVVFSLSGPNGAALSRVALATGSVVTSQLVFDQVVEISPTTWMDASHRLLEVLSAAVSDAGPSSDVIPASLPLGPDGTAIGLADVIGAATIIRLVAGVAEGDLLLDRVWAVGPVGAFVLRVDEAAGVLAIEKVAPEAIRAEAEVAVRGVADRAGVSLVADNGRRPDAVAPMPVVSPAAPDPSTSPTSLRTTFSRPADGNDR